VAQPSELLLERAVTLSLMAGWGGGSLQKQGQDLVLDMLGLLWSEPQPRVHTCTRDSDHSAPL
jgi:hypothetical protein